MKKTHKYSKENYKAKQIMLIEKFQEKSTYVKRQSKWCASRWDWTSNYLNSSLNMISFHYIDVFYEFLL